MEEYPSYRKEHKCKKCGSGDINDDYHKALGFKPCGYWHPGQQFPGEHIHRTCKNCGYEWAEAPLIKED